ncbi:unnamed protein product [Pleuronectes platessa]|uniref:Uncharacterized protein n=1 Tax=Pleuronectes platessa TaxID=8262 RepID=A0A9N7YR90_PLEPL|nr:unnamed protein product [Pleuronectes platessa]
MWHSIISASSPRLHMCVSRLRTISDGERKRRYRLSLAKQAANKSAVTSVTPTHHHHPPPPAPPPPSSTTSTLPHPPGEKLGIDTAQSGGVSVPASRYVLPPESS